MECENFTNVSLSLSLSLSVCVCVCVCQEMEVTGKKVKKFSQSGRKGKSGGKKDISGPIGIVLILL